MVLTAGSLAVKDLDFTLSPSLRVMYKSPVEK